MDAVRGRAARRAGLIAIVIVLLSLAPIGPSTAQTTGERIRSFRTAATVRTDGAVDVTEEIVYDFGPNERRGIIRWIPDRFSYDAVRSGFDRLTPITDVSVLVDGEPAPVDRTGESGHTVLKIGDEDVFLRGEHTYLIAYTLRGALNSFPDHDELYLNVTGNQWTVPIERAAAVVTTPGTPTDTACFAGPVGSNLPCVQEVVSGGEARFGHGTLPSGSGLTVVVGFPPGLVSPPPTPILEERWSLSRAFSREPRHLAVSGVLLAAVVGLFAFVLVRNGRDRRFAGGAVAASMGNSDGATELVPLRDDEPIPVEFVPPDGLRPGQVGTLIDETANTLDVTATIVDLASRGYLRITEIPKQGWLGSPDWQLDSTKPGQGLLPYENTLLTALFASGPSVRLSDLKDSFASHLSQVKEELYEDMIAKGWYRHRPDRTRLKAGCLAVVVLLAALAIAAVLAIGTEYGLAGIPLVLFGVLLLFANRVFPSRTAKGHAALRRTLGFRQFIEESEKDRARFAEQQHLFSEYLAYAVVFGAVDKWARAFAGLDGQLPRTDWYVSTYAFDAAVFSSAMSSFTTATSGTIASTPASTGSSGFSGGGSSGGGFGGGGGSSW